MLKKSEELLQKAKAQGLGEYLKQKHHLETQYNGRDTPQFDPNRSFAEQVLDMLNKKYSPAEHAIKLKDV